MKENASTTEARLRYSKYFPQALYFAYGINMGGLKESNPCENSSLTIRGLIRDEPLLDVLMKELESKHTGISSPKTLN